MRRVRSPDLDVFVSLGDAVKHFTYHRSASHSLSVLAALTPLVVWLILKVQERVPSARNIERLRALWDRIWSGPEVEPP
ncbi:MAG: hypothetical protein GWN84_09820 [Gammaproteobacteria bacterium]|nr:hypothetical protein [Gammaproteobacteria bacterium]NIR83161.1 hypothetical protein [Gammaproteobacteria bacterium]NIR90969.1 hypothetical protein [Gammaproteobacteria bacterium]NIU04326.1 hypothetical protein [Gammaproteobacteria bacterium]NIV76284.1 hypothetical protein [Gammaproteobacteria bacterium]